MTTTFTLGLIFDPLYFILIAPAFLLSLIAGWMVKSRFNWASQIRSPRGLTGAQVARAIADHHGLQHVPVEPSQGHLSDHYDPRVKALRLSPQVYGGNSLAAYAVAAHEVGHAIQDQTRYAPLVVRNLIVMTAGFGSNLGLILFMAGTALAAGASSRFGFGLMIGGIVLFSLVVFFQLVNLITEFDASARAKAALVDLGYVSRDEMPAVSKVLTAAALTYVAATLQAVLTLVYLVLKFNQSQNR
jgi:hypothetical protein